MICYAGWVDEELTRFAHQKNLTGRWLQAASRNDKREDDIFSRLHCQLPKTPTAQHDVQEDLGGSTGGLRSQQQSWYSLES